MAQKSIDKIRTDYPDPAVHDTLPKLLCLHAKEHPDEIAIREKDLGIWKPMTWRDYRDRVKDFAYGLKALGVEKGEVVGIIGDNRPDWAAAEIAIHAIGGMSLGIYRDALDQEVAYLINYGQMRVIFAEDEEQVDKLLALEDQIPSVEKIVYSDPRGMRKYDDPRLLDAADLAQDAEALKHDKPSLFDEMVQATSGDDISILCTTSGTTSNPKLAMFESGKFIRHVHHYLAADPKDETDEYVSVLPAPWIMEQIYVFGMALVSRMKVNFPEEQETAMHDLREIGPTFLLLAPRVWEHIAADVRSRIMDASPLKRWAFEVGSKMGIEAVEQGTHSKLADMLLFDSLRDRLGFSNLRSAATGGAAMGPETFKFFQAMGVPLRQLYGQTETMGAYTIHKADEIDVDTVGTAFEAAEIKIENPDANGLGEIVTRHPNMFSGYYKNEEATEADLRDGWMHTGDAGYFNDRKHLIVIDRVKDIATTSGGDRFSPQYIENKLKFSPYVAEAVILGDKRPYLAGMICIRYSVVSKWAEKNRLTFTTYTDLSAKPEIYELLREEVKKVNATLRPQERIQKFLLLYKELDADDGELTRTRKVRRGVVADKYADIIGAVYDGKETVDIDTTITFQDGTSQRIKTVLKVVDLGETTSHAGVTQDAAD
ncbi:MAG: AMP-binding protein [Alphaproteobacteria bacterium]|nr:AMP-binding protein [Alphaproteobacteria bacterium]